MQVHEEWVFSFTHSDMSINNIVTSGPSEGHVIACA